MAGPTDDLGWLWIHEYNHHRPHTAIGGRPHPAITRLTNLSSQYS